MTDKQHDAIAKWERRWLAASGLMSLVFMILIAYSLSVEGSHIAQASGRTQPELLLQSGSFANPKVTELSDGHFQVTGVAQMFSFMPSEIRVPEDVRVQFFLTSRDVLHGFQVEKTTINVELIPGEVSYFDYEFDTPGEYRLTCNEYCGISHQNMVGKVVVLSTEDYKAEKAAQSVPATVSVNQSITETTGITESTSTSIVENTDTQNQPQATEQSTTTVTQVESPPTSTMLVDESAYATNCMACHQANGAGLPSAFPPLSGHAAKLYEADSDYLINVILYGLQGQVIANGEKYNGVMPAWQHLSDEQTAGILNYILSSWDNASIDFEAYTASDIASQRNLGLQAKDLQALRKSLVID